MAEHIEFYFDFGSPNAYLAYKVIPEIEARLGPVVRMKPALLGAIFKATGNASPAVTLAGIPAKGAYERQVTQRFVRDHGLTRYRANPFFPINTLQLMRGAIAAERLGLFDAYVGAVYAGMWERALNMGEADVFQGVLGEAELPAEKILALIADPEVKQALIEATDAAVKRGAFGSPTFFVGEAMFFGKDQLANVEAEFLRQQAAEPPG
jgi:2-hydroxychromene-2-carboxylate isomerase